LIISGAFLQENIELRDYLATVLIFAGVFLVNKK
jgi:drug/metabolite transporter (DMT)-like permease